MTAQTIAADPREHTSTWRPAAELAAAVRGLVAQIPWDGADSEPAVRTIGLLGCSGGEGVTTLAAALAVELAAARRESVLLVDAHLARPAAHRLLGVRPGPGLAEAIHDGVRLPDLIQSTTMPQLSVLAAGQEFDDPSGGFSEAAGMVDALTEEFGFVVWDLPPATKKWPAANFAAHLDGLVLVVEAERTPLEAAHAAAAGLHAHGHLLGVVLNKRPTHTPDWLTRLL
jgi:Mrp family chromosome partitioning ATPase